jgi:hypothetical protein
MRLSQFSAGKFILAVFFTLLTSACFPTSQHPIIGTPMENLDGTFTGIWEGTLGDGPVSLIFIQQSQDDTGTTHIGGLVIAHHEERLALNEGWLEFEGEVVVIRDEVFLSVLLNQMDGRPAQDDEKGYYLYRAMLTKDTMSLVGLNELVIAELVDRGTVEGTVDRSLTVPSVRLTSTSQDLLGFLTNADLDEVFSSPFAQFSRKMR